MTVNEKMLFSCHNSQSAVHHPGYYHAHVEHSQTHPGVIHRILGEDTPLASNTDNFQVLGNLGPPGVLEVSESQRLYGLVFSLSITETSGRKKMIKIKAS